MLNRTTLNKCKQLGVFNFSSEHWFFGFLNRTNLFRSLNFKSLSRKLARITLRSKSPLIRAKSAQAPRNFPQSDNDYVSGCSSRKHRRKVRERPACSVITHWGRCLIAPESPKCCNGKMGKTRFDFLFLPLRVIDFFSIIIMRYKVGVKVEQVFICLKNQMQLENDDFYLCRARERFISTPRRKDS